ncbi:MAG: peptide deformylase [Proteobacteria bacterium]|nr:peptide deformylase [Pseudomonadota bacterium]
MARLSIIVAPDPRLKIISKPVETVDDRVRALMDDMLETMYMAPGVGLSAVQAGVPERIIVIDVAKDPDPPAPVRLVNPEIIWQADEIALAEEGCLSLPEYYADVERPAAVEVRYLDENGETRTIKAEGLLSTVLQHEMDHLEGILFVDHLSAIKRGIILRKLVKAKRLQAAGE